MKNKLSVALAIGATALIAVASATRPSAKQQQPVRKDSSASRLAPAPVKEVAGVTIVSVVPFAQDPRFATYTFLNDTPKPIAYFIYAKTENQFSPFSFYADGHLQPGASFERLLDFTMRDTHKVAAIAFADGSVAGEGFYAELVRDTHAGAVRAFARYAKTVEEARAAGAGDEEIAARLSAQAAAELAAPRHSDGADIAARRVRIDLSDGGASRGVAQIVARLRAIAAASPVR
jgi:hypothetical protein